MTTEIVTLNCPKCGSADQVIEKELRFNLEFKCKHCGSTSVLIMNNRLYLPLPGEKICVSCGRVAQRNARFCQCGESLVTKCINQDCLLEIAVDHEICDYCGWRQNVEPYSDDGDKISFKLSINKYLDPELSMKERGREIIEGMILTSRDSNNISTMLNELATNGIDITRFVVQIEKLIEDSEIQIIAQKMLDIYGHSDSRKLLDPSKSQKYIEDGLVSALKYAIENRNKDSRIDMLNIFDEFFSKPLEQSTIKRISMVAIEWIPDIVTVMNKSKNYHVKDQCKQILVFIGSSAIPILEKCKRNKETTQSTREWIDHAIEEIQGKKYT